jgi:hypothetical protein
VDKRTSFILITIFLNGAFEYGDGGILKLPRWIQNLHQSTWGHSISYAERSLNDEEILMRQLCEKPKTLTWRAVKNEINIFYFMLTAHETFDSDKLSFVQ